MGSCKPPKQTFDAQELEALDLALTGALATAKELGLRRRGLRATLRRRLFEVASQGITDPQTLRDEALKSMNVDKTAR